MKKFLLAALFLVSTAVFAESVVVLDKQLPGYDNYSRSVDARFQVDKNTTEGFVDVTVTEMRPDYGGYNRGPMMCDQFGRCYPQRMPMPMPVVVYSEKVKVEGLMLMGDKVMFHGAEGNVDCGTLGESRIFHRPTIYLNGNCKLSGRVTGNYRNTRVVVTLTTK